MACWMNNCMKTAILIVGYNRPDSLTTMLDSLRLCEEHKELHTYFVIDGPRRLSDASSVNECLDIANLYPSNQKTVIHHKKNLGLKSSIMHSVSLVLESFDSVIVLEDDLVLSSKTLEYFLNSLNVYAAKSNVHSICGYMPEYSHQIPHEASEVLLPWAHPWGWATWKNRWGAFVDHRESLALEYEKSKALRILLNIGGIRDFSRMLDLNYKGMLDSWYIEWFYHISLMGGVSVFPQHTLIKNQGLQSGTHANTMNPLIKFLNKNEIYDETIVITEPEYIDISLMETIRNSRESRIFRIIDLVGFTRRYTIFIFKNLLR